MESISEKIARDGSKPEVVFTRVSLCVRHVFDWIPTVFQDGGIKPEVVTLCTIVRWNLMF